MIKYILILLFVAAVAGLLGYSRISGVALKGATLLVGLVATGILFLILLITLFGG